MTCGKTLRWYELLPVISFCLQKGKCRQCGVPMSIQYPLVEICTGILFGLVGFFFFESTSVWSIVVVVFWWVVVAILMVIAVYDFFHFIIPNRYVYSFIVLSLVSIGVKIVATPNEGVLLVLSGLLVALPFAFLWFISRGTWMGFGDVKLALGIGWFLGMSGGFSAVMYAFWLGALYGIPVLTLRWLSNHQHFRLFRRSKRFTMKSEVPFGPFLIAGFMIVLFTGYNLGHLFTGIFL